MIKSMGLDLSTRAGLVVLQLGSTVPLVAREIEFKKLTGMNRCAAIAKEIQVELERHQPDRVVLEGYGYANANSLVTLCEIGTVVRYFLWQEDFAFEDVAPNKLKKFVTGSGCAGKDLVMMNIFKRWGYEAKTNNIADAYGLAAYGLAKHAVMPGITKAMLEMVQV